MKFDQLKDKDIGSVEVALTIANADNVKQWIRILTGQNIELPNGIPLDGGQIMMLLAEIPPEHRIEVYKKYNSGTIDDFKYALLRLRKPSPFDEATKTLREATKRLEGRRKEPKNWWQKLMKYYFGL